MLLGFLKGRWNKPSGSAEELFINCRQKIFMFILLEVHV